MSKLQTYWQNLSLRERKLVRIGCTAVLAALLWWLALAPALKVIRTAPAQLDQLTAQVQTMQALQAQAQSLQALPRLTLQDAQRALNASTQTLGSTTSMQLMGDQAQVNFNAISADALASWLTQVRQNAKAVPTQIQLKRVGAATWSGSMTVHLYADQ